MVDIAGYVIGVSASSQCFGWTDRVKSVRIRGRRGYVSFVGVSFVVIFVEQ